MKRFNVVAYKKARYEVVVEAANEQEARDKAYEIPETEWLEDNEYYRFEITDVEVDNLGNGS